MSVNRVLIFLLTAIYSFCHKLRLTAFN